MIDGEIVRIRPAREHKSFFEATLDEIVKPSPHRVEPPCPFYARCGGCVYQHITYDHQLVIKQKQVEESLQRLGKFREVPINPIIRSPIDYGYRNRITVHRENGAIGYRERGSNRIVDVDHCLIANDEVNEKLSALRQRPPRTLRGDHFNLRSHREETTFHQVNDSILPKLLETVRAQLSPDSKVLIDAYAGTGLYARSFTDNYDEVTAIEWSAPAVERGRASSNGEEKVQFIQDDAAVALPSLLPEKAAQLRNATLILNPPSQGIERSIPRAIAQNPPSEIIYVSCSPPTLARDLRRLVDTGHYELTSVTPVDLFPQTAEVEAIAKLSPLTRGS